LIAIGCSNTRSCI